MYTIYAPGSSIPWVWAFNAVASLCSNGNFIAFVWSTAVAASLFGFARAIASSVNLSAEETNKRMGTSIISMIISGLIALSLTGAANWKLQIEDMQSGVVTEVDNVPMAASFLQWGATNLFTNGFSKMLETVTQDTGASSADLSVGAQGFLNPVNSLLSARKIIANGLTAPAADTGAVDASIGNQLNQIIAYCLTPAPSSLAADIANPQSNTPYVQLSNENSATSVGVILGYAAQSSGTIPLFNNNAGEIVPCAAAVTQYAANVQSGLSNTQFSALAVKPDNKAEPTTVQNDFGKLITVQQAFGSVIANGQRDASKEVLNMLFYDLVDENLKCIQASGTSKTNCLIQAEQIKVKEQSNLDNAANAFQLTTYAASFPNFLGPITVVLMVPLLIMCMFSGAQGLGKAITSMSHVILWPIVIYSIGAPVVNGLMSNYIGRQLDWITANGAMNHPQVAAWYAVLSQSVGAMSTIQASIGTFIAIIFGFGAAAGIVAVSQAMAGKDRFNEKLFTPELNNAPALTDSNNYLGNIKQAGGNSLFVPNGQVPMTAGNIQAGAMAATRSNQVQEQIRLENTRTQLMSDAESWHKGLVYSHTSGTGNKSTVGTSTGDSTSDRDSSSATTKIGLSGGNTASTGTRAIAGLVGRLGIGGDGQMGNGGAPDSGVERKNPLPPSGLYSRTGGHPEAGPASTVNPRLPHTQNPALNGKGASLAPNLNTVTPEEYKEALGGAGGANHSTGQNHGTPPSPNNTQNAEATQRPGATAKPKAGSNSNTGQKPDVPAAGRVKGSAEASAGGEVNAYAQNDYRIGQDWSKMTDTQKLKARQEALSHDYKKEYDQHGNTEKAKSFAHKLDQINAYSEAVSRKDGHIESSGRSDENKNAATAYSTQINEGTVLNAINEPGNQLKGYVLGQGQQYMAAAQKADPVKFGAVESDWQSTFGNSQTMKELKNQDYAAYQALHQDFVAGRLAGEDGMVGLLSQKQIFDSFALMNHMPASGFSNNLPSIQANVHDIPEDRHFLDFKAFGGDTFIPGNTYTLSPDLNPKDNGAEKKVSGKIGVAEVKATANQRGIKKDEDTNEGVVRDQYNFATANLGLSATNDNAVLPTALNTGVQGALQGTAQAGLALNKAVGTLPEDATVPTPMTAPPVFNIEPKDKK